MDHWHGLIAFLWWCTCFTTLKESRVSKIIIDISCYVLVTQTPLTSRRLIGITYKTRWWFHIFFTFTPKIGGDEPTLTSIFFKWVDSTTNEKRMSILLVAVAVSHLSWPSEVQFMEDEAWIRGSGEKRSGAVSPAVFGSGFLIVFAPYLAIVWGSIWHTHTHIYI